MAVKPRSIEETAREIFGPEDRESIDRWVGYWKESLERNRRLLKPYQDLLQLDFRGKRVLDIGCGPGGLGRLISEKCRLYVGGEYHRHVLQFAEDGPNRAHLQCDGIQLPFADEVFDYIFAFDVIEHLVGGEEWQLRFLQEIGRVLTKSGMLFLTTPNRWYPYEGHTGLYFPQYLPRFWADRYVARCNPGFLKEHGTFSEIQLISPRKLRRLLKRSGLRFLHDLPCCMDRMGFMRQYPLWGWLAYLGAGWSLHAEFWGVLVREEERARLCLELKDQWPRRRDRLLSESREDLAACIDFDRNSFGHQLTVGWHDREIDGRGFRWTGRRAVCYLKTHEEAPYLEILGYSPVENHLEVWVDGVRVGEHFTPTRASFDVRYLIPFADAAGRALRVELVCRELFRSSDPMDERELGLVIYSLGLEREAAPSRREAAV